MTDEEKNFLEKITTQFQTITKGKYKYPVYFYYGNHKIKKYTINEGTEEDNPERERYIITTEKIYNRINEIELYDNYYLCSTYREVEEVINNLATDNRSN